MADSDLDDILEGVDISWEETPLEDEDELQERLGQIESEAVQEIRAEELSGLASRKTTGVSPAALSLARPGLNVPSPQAQKVYAELGRKLYKGKGLRKQDRRNLVAARRILEEEWGISLLRSKTEPVSDYATISMPSRTEMKTARQATVVFERKRKGFGKGSRVEETMKAILYGVEAQEEADALVLEGLKRDLAAAKARRARRGKDAKASRDIDEIEMKLKHMQDRRQRQADLLSRALGDLGLAPLGEAEKQEKARKQAEARKRESVQQGQEREKMRARILKHLDLNDPSESREIQEELGMGEEDVLSALKLLEKQGLVYTDVEAGTVVYFLVRERAG